MFSKTSMYTHFVGNLQSQYRTLYFPRPTTLSASFRTLQFAEGFQSFAALGNCFGLSFCRKSFVVWFEFVRYSLSASMENIVYTTIKHKSGVYLVMCLCACSSTTQSYWINGFKDWRVLALAKLAQLWSQLQAKMII